MKNIGYILLFFVSMCFMSCEREYMPPPLTEPQYKGKAANITIKQLKDRFSKISDPVLIEEELIFKGIVTGNDESGNIYKQIYVQDETAAINIGVEQNAVYGKFQVGQEVFVNLKDLYILKYGGELQIGLSTTNANRISWLDFQEKVQLNSWPNPANAIPKVIELNKLTDEMVNQLVEVKDIRFSNGGKNPFSSKDATTNEEIKNKDGNVMIVRTSNYSNFSQDMLPLGNGGLVGILGRFNGTWQLLLRTSRDIKSFDGQEPEGNKPVSGSFFKETFGKGTYPSGNRPKVADFNDFDMKAPVKYTEELGSADVRSVSGDNGAHVWLPANKESNLKITGINTRDKGDVTLNFQLTANLFDATAAANLNQIQVKVNGKLMNIPSKEVSNAAGDNNKWYTISIPNIDQSNNVTIEFISKSDLNKVGFRLDNIELIGGAAGQEVIIVKGDKKR